MTDQSHKNHSSYVNWKSLPGGFDALNTKHIYPSNNAYGIPDLAHAPISAVPEKLAPYRSRVRSPDVLATTGVHFFLDDYRFESIWRRPVQTLSGIQKWAVALTPDFSLYYNAPRIIQLWNTYRTRTAHHPSVEYLSNSLGGVLVGDEWHPGDSDGQLGHTYQL